MIFRRTKQVLAAAVCSVLATAAVAQEKTAQKQKAQEEQTMKKISVQAEEDALGYVSVTARGATKTDAPLIEVPQAITVITAEQIKDQNANTLQEVLRYAPGVRAEVYGVDNRGDWFTLRGGSEGSTLLDGLRLPLTGYYGVVRNEPYAFERIEVLRGPSSVIAGQNGPGGTVNLVSKRPQASAHREVAVQYGNFKHKQIAADLTGPISDQFLYRVVALANESDTQINYADQERQYLAPSLTWLPSEWTSLTVYGEYQQDRSKNTNAFLPWAGTALPAPNGPVPSELFIGEPDWDEYGGERTRVGFALEQRLSSQWQLRLQLRHDDVEGRMRSMYAAFYNYTNTPFDFAYGSNALGDNRTIGRQWYASDDEGKITNAEILLEGHFNTGIIQHTLLASIDGVRASNQIAYTGGYADELDVYAPVYGTFAEPTPNDGDPITTLTHQFGMLLQDQMKIAERYVVVASVRRDSSKSEEENNPLSKRDDDAWTKRLGFVYLHKGVAPYISYSESFEPIVSGTDVDGQPFKPKRGKQVETGIKYVPESGNVSANAAVYRLTETNRVSPNPTNPNLPGVQRGEVTVEGVELEAVLNLSAWDVSANYTYTNAKQTASSSPANDATLGKKLVSVPTHSASLWAVSNFGIGDVAGFRAGLGVRYVGETWDGTDTLSTPSNTLLDALLAFNAGPWGIALNASNLADKDYIATCLDRGDCWFGSRREIVGTVSFRF